MNILKDITMAKKLLVVMLMLSILPLLLVSYISYEKASNELEMDAFNQLISIRDIKAYQIENYFQEREGDMAVLSVNPIVTESLPLFSEAFKNGTDSQEYAKLESEYGSQIRYYLEQYGYYDIFLIDNEGNIVYTVAKESDFGTNLETGKYGDTSLAEVYEIGKKRIAYVDATEYEPSNYEPAMFMAGPVKDGNKVIGVLAFQLSTDQIDTIMQNTAGMGESGESYLVGPDLLMRSDSRFSANTLLEQSVDTQDVHEALSGNEGILLVEDYRGIEVLSAYSYLELDGFTWAILAQIDKSEAFSVEKDLLQSYAVAIGIAFMAVLVVGIYFSRSITMPINEVVEAAKKMADNDFAVNVEYTSKDEIGQLSDAIRTMSANLGMTLRQLVEEVRQNALKVSSTAEEMSASSEEITVASSQVSGTVSEISKGSQVQAVKTEEVSRAMIDMTLTVQEVATSSQKAAETARASNELIISLGSITSDLLGRMDNIKAASSDSSGVISQLDEKSKQIGEIVSLITSIADQTNLLALNAAIEAARAGEYGRGFAVVADEVRKLAENSGNAANQISHLIAEIQEGTSNAVESMSMSAEHVSTGADALNEVVLVIEKVVEAGENIVKMVEDIAAATQEQSASIEEVTTSVEEVSTIAEQSAASTNEASAAVQEQTSSIQELSKSAQELAAMAEVLEAATARFNLK